MNNNENFGRLRVIKELAQGVNGLSLNIGCKQTRFGDINLDIDTNTSSDIIADALNLPFKSNTFDLVYFTDIIEHLPKNTEIHALMEIYRVLKPGGVLILTTPNDKLYYTYLDPAKYIISHRHYRVETIRNMVVHSGFKIKQIFTAGAIWELIGVWYYCVIIYLISRLFDINLSMPKFLLNKIDVEYRRRTKKDGYTVFIKAIK